MFIKKHHWSQQNPPLRSWLNNYVAASTNIQLHGKFQSAEIGYFRHKCSITLTNITFGWRSALKRPTNTHHFDQIRKLPIMNVNLKELFLPYVSLLFFDTTHVLVKLSLQSGSCFGMMFRSWNTPIKYLCTIDTDCRLYFKLCRLCYIFQLKCQHLEVAVWRKSLIIYYWSSSRFQ